MVGDKKACNTKLNEIAKKYNVPVAEIKLLMDTDIHDALMESRLCFKEIDAYMVQHNLYLHGGQGLSTEDAFELWKQCEPEIQDLIDGGKYETYIEAREDVARLLRKQLTANGVYNRSSAGKGNNNRTTDRGVQKSKRDRFGNDGRHPDGLDTEV